MARTRPSSWSTFERFNVSFERVAAGWDEIDAGKAASILLRNLGLRIQPVQEKAVQGRLFMVGDMGYLGTDKAPSTLHKVGDSLELVGALKVERRGESLAGPLVSMEQQVEGIPVYGSEMTLHLNRKGEGYALTGTPVPKGVEIRRIPRKIDSGAAAEVVAGALNTKARALSWEGKEVLLPTEQGLLPCYHIEAFAWEPFGTWYGFVSTDGNLLALFNVASSANGAATGYEVNPLRSALTTLQLTNLNDPPTALNSQTSRVWGPGHTQIPSPNGDFSFGPNQLEFDQPQMYFFLERCRAAATTIAAGQLGPLLQNPGKFNPMQGTVHVAQAANNAFYDPTGGQLFFGDITIDAENRYTSRSLDIVLHEFGHAISDSICRLGQSSSNTQSRGMSEGYSDYFAATVLDNPIIGDYFMNDPAGFRSCDNSNRFPSGYAGEEHDVGNVWSGFLWDLRKNPRVGISATDGIVLQSLSYLGPWRTILQGLDAVVQADRVLFPEPSGTQGQHEEAIRAAFDARRP
jgi:Fungalysin metallopeptidase (M36)/Fungalysin/Thermolysin Propeptide Motif